MRIDKYLKVSRLIKRRTLAKEVAENERILVNGKVVKPSKELGAVMEALHEAQISGDVLTKNDAIDFVLSFK